MAAETADDDKIDASASSGAKQTREQSSIGFPYGDLEDAVAVATALMSCGGVPCDADQLAGAMKQTPSSGAFRQKIAVARIFGIIETIQGKYQLTPIGFAITDATRQKAARADAFLNVPLYRKVYETFRNQQLPPRPIALERTFVGFGVAQKVADKARMAFDRSAQQAGFFEQGGRDRLIRPPVGSATNGAAAEQTQGSFGEEQPQDQDTRRKGGGGNGHPPFVQMLLDTLPEPGTLWAMEGRVAWLEAAATSFKLMYKGDGKIAIQVESTKQNGGRA